MIFSYIKNTIKALKCKNSYFYRTYPPNLDCLTINSRINISHNKKFCYFRIPKAANSTVIASLFAAEYGKAYFQESELHTKIKSQMYEHPCSLSKTQVNNLLDNYYKFTFVRNPYTRFLSSFLDKVQRPDAKQRKMVANFLNKSVKEELSIYDFLDFLDYKPNLNSNAHWCLQKDIILLPKEKIDFIGRFENLKEDLATVIRVIFHYEIDDQIVNIKTHSTGANKKISMLRSDQIYKRVFKIYEEDFDYFEYSPTLEL